MSAADEALLEEILAMPPVEAHERIAYGDHEQQFVDVYLPARQRAQAKLVLALQGGFWRARYDLAHLSHACAALAEAGFVVGSVEYRRVGHEGGGVPGTLEDVQAALSRMLSEASRFGCAANVVHLLGHSAGGHLALWLAKHAPPSCTTKVLALAPVADLLHARALGLGAGIVETFVGGTPEQVPAAYAFASPAAQLPLGVRQVLVHGEQDDVVPPTISQEYQRRAHAAGDDVRLVLLPVGHYALIAPRSHAWTDVLEALGTLA